MKELIKPIILLIFGGTLLLMAVRRLRVYKLKERYTLLFLAIGTPFLALAIWPNGVGWLAKRLGIEYGTVSLLCVTAFLILMIFELLTIVSLQDRKITTLAQIVGIMMEKHGLSDRGVEKGSGTFAGTARRVLRTKVPDPFSTPPDELPVGGKQDD